MNGQMCEYPHDQKEFHTNAFIDLNGLPYLLADYLDKRTFQQIDRSLVKSEIMVDQSEAMRAVVDINVDDIGHNSDSTLQVLGNATKQINLVNMIQNNLNRIQGHLGTLRKGLVIKVNYQIENYRTGGTLRSMVERFRIPNASYFLNINPKDINDNAIVDNYSGSAVSTINCFQHGTDQLVLRITNIEMFYEKVEPGNRRPIMRESLVGCGRDVMPSEYGDEFNMYQYHSMLQNHHLLTNSGIREVNEDILPPDWTYFSHYYHFDNNGMDITVHTDEVYDPKVRTTLIPCGIVMVNRAFVVNPCHRIVFKFSIWKNDTTIVNDTRMIADAMKVPVYDPYCDCVRPVYPTTPNMIPDHCGNYHIPPRPINPDHETLIRMYKNGETMDYEQNAVINQLSNVVSELTAAVKELKGVTEDPSEEPKPEIPTLPEAPKEEHHHHHHGDHIQIMMDMIKELQKEIKDLKGEESGEGGDDNCNCPDYKPLEDEDIKDIVNDAVDKTSPDGNGTTEGSDEPTGDPIV